MPDINYFTNDKFRALLFLYKARGQDNCARVTQQEVATAMGLSLVTMNGIFKQLKEDGYIEQDKERLSKYLLTNKALDAMKMFILP